MLTPEVGATQIRIHEFARACPRRGHRVTVLTAFPNHPHGQRLGPAVPLACARPIILMVDGEAREILEASGAGVFAPPGSADGLVKAVLRLLLETPEEDLRRMGAPGRAYVLANYTRAERSAQLVVALVETMGAPIDSGPPA